MDIGDIIKLDAYWTIGKDHGKLGIILERYVHKFDHHTKQYKVWFFIDQDYKWTFSSEMSKV